MKPKDLELIYIDAEMYIEKTVASTMADPGFLRRCQFWPIFMKTFRADVTSLGPPLKIPSVTVKFSLFDFR